MSELQRTASEIEFTGYKTELLARREILEQQLAGLALNLADVNALIEKEPVPMIMQIGVGYKEWRDRGYTPGFTDSVKHSAKTFNVVSNSLELAFLAGLTRQPYPLTSDISINEADGPAFRSHIAIDLQRLGAYLHEDNDTVFVATLSEPTKDTIEAFYNSKRHAFEVLDSIKQRYQTEEPHKDVKNAAVWVNSSRTSVKAVLEDAWLRAEILEYCKAADASFVIEVDA